jgi:acetyl esterase/lipase
MKYGLTFLIALIAGNLFAQNYTLYSDIPYDTIAGVPSVDLSLDVYVPKNASGARPVLIYNHGGFFTGNGDKGSTNFKDEVFADSGYVMVSINHRKYAAPPFPPYDPNRVLYPVPAQDAARAIRWVYDNIGMYGGDVSRIGIIGHSSGGHQISILATDETLLGAVGLPLSTLKCACALDPGGYDIPIYLSIAANSQVASYSNAFGENDTLRWIAGSPARQIKTANGTPDFYLVASENAKKRFLMHLMADSLAAHGVAVDTFFSSTLEHADVDNYIGAPGDTIMTWRVMGFFKNCFSNLVSSTKTPIGSEKSAGDFEIFPNPANSIFNVLIKSDVRNESLRVHDVLGKTVIRQKISGQAGERFSFETRDWSAGLYFIEIGGQVRRLMVYR